MFLKFICGLLGGFVVKHSRMVSITRAMDMNTKKSVLTGKINATTAIKDASFHSKTPILKKGDTAK